MKKKNTSKETYTPLPSKELKKRIEKLKKENIYRKEFTKNEETVLSKYSLPKSKTTWVIIGSIIFILLSFVFMAITLVNFFLFHKPFGWFGIFSFLIGLPIFLANIIVLVVILIYKSQRIKSIVTTVLSRNYIIAEFFTSARKKYKVVIPINSDGISFSIGKREYIIDMEEIWYNNKKQPCSHYVPELPNPLKFNFEKNIKIYFEKLKNVGTEKDGSYSIENDIAFSSTNLQLYKKDKVFRDLNKPENSVDQKTFTTMIIFAGIIIVVLLVVCIVAIVT